MAGRVPPDECVVEIRAVVVGCSGWTPRSRRIRRPASARQRRAVRCPIVLETRESQQPSSSSIALGVESRTLDITRRDGYLTPNDADTGRRGNVMARNAQIALFDYRRGTARFRLAATDRRRSLFKGHVTNRRDQTVRRLFKTQVGRPAPGVPDVIVTKPASATDQRPHR